MLKHLGAINQMTSFGQSVRLDRRELCRSILQNRDDMLVIASWEKNKIHAIINRRLQYQLKAA